MFKYFTAAIIDTGLGGFNRRYPRSLSDHNVFAEIPRIRKNFVLYPQGSPWVQRDVDGKSLGLVGRSDTDPLSSLPSVGRLPSGECKSLSCWSELLLLDPGAGSIFRRLLAGLHIFFVNIYKSSYTVGPECDSNSIHPRTENKL
jgi:hypothetical protein